MGMALRVSMGMALRVCPCMTFGVWMVLKSQIQPFHCLFVCSFNTSNIYAVEAN